MQDGTSLIGGRCFFCRIVVIYDVAVLMLFSYLRRLKITLRSVGAARDR